MKKPNTLNSRSKKVVLLLLIAVVCIMFSLLALRPEAFKPIFSVLNEKRNAAMAIATTASGVAIAISFLPNDYGIPIANEISKASSYVLIAVCVLMMEKFMMTAFWVIAFGIILPLVCVLKIYSLFKENDNIYNYSFKLAAFAVAIVCIVPLSVGLTALIEKSQNISLQNAKEQIEEIDSSFDEDSGFWEKVKSGVGATTEKLKIKLNGFIDSLAVMLITTCGIPIFVLFFMFWIIKILFGIDIKISKPKGFVKKARRKTQE